LTDDARAAGAERRANRDFLPARQRTREQEIGDVGARDEQHESDGANQHDERAPDVADDLFLQRHDAEGQSAVGRIRQAG
jgi:hypothetical protein